MVTPASNDGRLQAFQRALLERQGELKAAIARAEVQIPGQTEPESRDVGERATAAQSQESLLQQLGHDRFVLRLVGEALDRIAAGTYGSCLECDESITLKRLEAIPWAPLCHDCQARDDERLAIQQGGAPSPVVA